MRRKGSDKRITEPMNPRGCKFAPERGAHSDTKNNGYPAYVKFLQPVKCLFDRKLVQQLVWRRVMGN